MSDKPTGAERYFEGRKADPDYLADYERNVRMERQRQVESALHDAVRRSVTSASHREQTVLDPAEAAQYVVNMLTRHRLDLLAELADVFTNRIQRGEDRNG